MTSYEQACEPLWHLLEDVSSWDPSIYRNLKVDLQGLQDLVRTRGLRILLSSLPKGGKVFDSSLSSGLFRPSDLPEELVTKLGPKFFRSLLEQVFDLSDYSYGKPCPIYSEVDPNVVFFIRQFLYLYKKVKVPCPDSCTSATASKFFSIDTQLREPTLHWAADPDFWSSSLRNMKGKLAFSFSPEKEMGRMLPSGDHYTLRRALRVLDYVVSSVVSSGFPAFDTSDILPKHGPGAVADLKTGEDKYSFPIWSKKLDWMFDESIFAYSSEEWARSASDPQRRYHEPLGRLLAVPKTHDEPRLITAEPTAHQFLQQGLLHWIRKELPYPLRCCIDFKSQEPSRSLALLSSRNKSHATVDLSAASDRLSCWTVERVFGRSTLMNALYASRTVVVQDHTLGAPGELSILRKFAGQGSAVTFPVQSIVYACCAIAACICSESVDPRPTRRSILRAAKSVQVFGDDLIVPKGALVHLALILEFLQLKINASKTHYQGAFRESCGMDAFSGEDVTPVYLQHLELDGTSPVELTSWVDVTNNAHSRGLWHLSKYLERRIPQRIRALLPVSDQPLGCLTLRTYSSGTTHHLERWNENLHRSEVKGLVLVPKSKRSQREGHRELHDFFVNASTRKETPYNFQGWTSWSSGFTVNLFYNLKKRWVART